MQAARLLKFQNENDSVISDLMSDFYGCNASGKSSYPFHDLIYPQAGSDFTVLLLVVILRILIVIPYIINKTPRVLNLI